MTVPVLRDSDEWRDVVKRLVDFERRLGITDSKVDKLVDRQELQHAENKRELENQEEQIRRVGKMLVGEKGDNGLVGTVTLMRADVSDIKETFRHLPKTILTILLIFGAAIALLTFLGPSLRKAIGLNASATSYRLVEQRSLDTSIPSTIATRAR